MHLFNLIRAQSPILNKCAFINNSRINTIWTELISKSENEQPNFFQKYNKDGLNWKENLKQSKADTYNSSQMFCFHLMKRRLVSSLQEIWIFTFWANSVNNNCNKICLLWYLNSQFSRYSTPRRSNTSIVTVGRTKVKVCKSILFTKGICEVKISYLYFISHCP